METAIPFIALALLILAAICRFLYATGWNKGHEAGWCDGFVEGTKKVRNP
jgi:hypothetical protein